MSEEQAAQGLSAPQRLLSAVRAVGMLRTLIGVGALAAPQSVGRVLLAEPHHAGARVLLRMFAGREIALGVGQLLAARRGPAAARGWIEAGALADGVDVIALAGSGRALRPWPRWGGAASALSATVAAVLLARGLSGR